ncbi:centromere protein U isoform X2 [Rhineura floridana]|uniref:centromere protein U isoform X2 n=1 Tax=Rhineura floridana TaxID=261503 RepID=UPI002AC7F682|nr:centromere protein U isoform X2 [Rhineura floridana]
MDKKEIRKTLSVHKKMPKRKTRRDSGEKLGEPDVSSILKVPRTEPAEDPDELFDEPLREPLHSTAVSAYEEEDQYSDGSTSSSSNSEPKKKNTIGSKNQHILKSRAEREDSEVEPLKENMRATESTPSAEDYRLPSALPLRSSSSECRVSGRITDLVKNLNSDKMPKKSAKPQVKQKEASSPEMEIDYPDSDAEPHLIKVWGTKGVKKVARRVTELDVIVDEFEKVTAKCKEEVELKTCRKAIDKFYIGFRDQLTNNVANAEELKKTKLKNVQMVRATNKKRQRLIELKEELIKTEPQLKKLEREYAELKGKISSLRNAVQLVTNLKELQQKYVNIRKENPQEKVVGFIQRKFLSFFQSTFSWD